jgi:paraquat-inducible protein B
MSKKANPVKVGAFVLTGLAILVVTVALLGSSRVFSRPVKVVTYFESSVNGLVPGAPVKFKGVTIGQVLDISLMIHSDDQATIPVILEIDQNSIHEEPRELAMTNPLRLKKAVDKGLRATLEMESFVTGRLYVSLDVFADAGEPTFIGDGDLPEIPTRRGGLKKLLQSLNDVDVAGIGRQLNEILSKLNTSLSELNVKALNAKLDKLLGSAEDLISSPKIVETVDSFRTTAKKAQDVLDALESEIKPVGTKLQLTADEATSALTEMRQAVSDLRQVLSVESPVMSELTRAMEEISDAARSLRLLSDGLARDPSILIKGTPRPSGQ